MKHWHQLNEIEQGCIRAANLVRDNGAHVKNYQRLERLGLVYLTETVDLHSGRSEPVLQFHLTEDGFRCVRQSYLS